MANLITEIFVSVDGLEFTKLDLHKDESIIMKYTQKDLQDISKIFAPYSQNFTFPATPKNRRAFGFFGDTTVLKINTEKKYFCKIYSSGQLYQNGYLMLSDLSYKNNRPIDFTGSFANNITNLKDRIADDTLNDLGSYLLEWLPSKAYSLLQGTESNTIDGINYLYYVPLVSNSRVWSYNETDVFENFDNIAYKVGNSPTSNNLVKISELRPALSFRTIYDLIIKRYGLEVIMPLYERNEFNKLFVWCNSESFLNSSYRKLILKNNLGNEILTGADEELISTPYKYIVTSDITDSSYKIEIINNDADYSKFVELNLTFQNILILTEIQGQASVDISLIKKGEESSFITNTFNFSNGTLNCSITIPDNTFIANEVEFYIYAKFNQPVNWNNNKVHFRYYYATFIGGNGVLGVFDYYSNVNNNYVESGAGTIDLIKTLPNTKVIDFLNSFIKSFNISIYDTSPNDNKLYFLTPEDVNTNGLVYSKATLDYTPYVDIKEHKKSVPSEYNYYNFKHATSKYRSNVDYKSQTGLEYGQTTYPSVKPSNPKEFKVETNFSIIPPRIVRGSNNIVTAYGFTADTPTILDSGESRYTPNWNELTLFYKNENFSDVIEPIGFQNQPIGGALTYNKIVYYFISTPFRILNPQNTDDFSLAFSILKESNILYPKNLFTRYYQSQIIRYLDANVLSQEYSLTLPASELYLNEATTIQGGGATPVGFRLQNDIIIGETKFSILDAPIDITTGKVKMTLLNY
ncbi:MAG: hypothetical protein KAZ71_06150 [Bacteroidia bacterium]|nr:hypothetical protein [Bacteroidia bacterium]